MAQRASKSSQRGVAAIFAAISLLTLLSALALAIDVGRLYFAQRDLQRVADLAAMDAVRIKSQCMGPAGLDEITAEALASLKRNGAEDIKTPQVLLGIRSAAVGVDYQFVATPAGVISDSVQVAVSRPSPSRLLPLFQGDAARTLKAQAAAISTVNALPLIGDPTSNSADTQFANDFYGGLLGGNLGLTADQYHATANASVRVANMVNGSATGAINLPDLNVPQPIQGLLSQIAALLNQQGDAAAASAVQAYAAAIGAGRGAVNVVPAQLLGLPPDAPQSTYDGATVPVGALLNSLAAVIANGDAITIPLNLPPPLGDSSMTIQLAQPGTPGSMTPGSSSSSVSSSDSAFSAAGLIRFELNLVEPVSGQAFKLPLTLAVSQQAPKTESVSCARLGQASHIVTVLADPPRAQFSLGRTDPYDSEAGDLLNVVNSTVPTEILKLNLVGQTVSITTIVAPITLGGGGTHEFCFEGPPWGAPVQCNGSAAYVGGVSPQDIVPTLSDAITRNLMVAVKLPDNLPLGLGSAVEAAVNPIAASVTDLLKKQLQVLVAQLVPKLQLVNLNLGASPVYVKSVDVTQPAIYAR